MKLYILVNKEPKETAHSEWHHWKRANDNDCVVGKECLPGVTVETRFRGFDVQGAGYLFFTKVCGGKYDGEQYGSKTWKDAENTHENICERERQGYAIDLVRKARTR